MVASGAPTRKIMYVSASGDLLGGSEVCLLDVAARVKEHGWEALVVVPHEGDLSAALARAGVEYKVMALGSFRNRAEIRRPIFVVRLLTALVAAWRLSRLIHSRQVDLVHSNTAPVIAGALGARIARIPHVWHLREILSGWQWFVLRRLMVKLAARQICISRTVAETLAGTGTNGAVVIADGVDVEAFAPAADSADGPGLAEPTQPGDAGNGTVVAMLARVHPDKGHELFLRAAKLALDLSPGTKFLLVGGCLPAYEGLRRQLVELRDGLGLARAASFLPQVERERLPELFRSLSVVVVPSTWVEPGGLVVLEAMASGVPVVATQQGGPAEVISDGLDGFLVSSADPSEMAGRIDLLIRDRELRTRMGAAGRSRVAAAYSRNSHLERITALYDEVIDQAPGH
jgi:glycosyltransferase involved in cell wall biosynthesis